MMPNPLFQRGGVGLNPTIQGSMVDRDAAVRQHGREVAIADRESQILAQRPQDNLRCKVPALEPTILLDCHHHSLMPASGTSSQAPTPGFLQHNPTVGPESRARRLALYEEIRRRHNGGEPLLAISRQCASRVARFEAMPKPGAFLSARLRKPGRVFLTLTSPISNADWRRAENALALWRELRARGFHGTRRQVSRRLQPRRATPSPFGSRPASHTAQPTDLTFASAPAILPSAQSMAWMMVKNPASLLADEVAAIDHIAQDGEAGAMVALVRRFTALVRANSIAATIPSRAPARVFWRQIRDAGESGLRAMATFAAGLQKDAAVQATLSARWSNAQSEGHITRLKLLRRQMHGRANFDLLRRRVLLSD